MLGLSHWDSVALSIWVESVAKDITPLDYWQEEMLHGGTLSESISYFRGQANMFSTLYHMLEDGFWNDIPPNVESHPKIPVHPEVKARLDQILKGQPKGQWPGKKEGTEFLQYVASRPEYVHEDALFHLVRNAFKEAGGDFLKEGHDFRDGLTKTFPDLPGDFEWRAIADYYDQVAKFDPDSLVRVERVEAALPVFENSITNPIEEANGLPTV